MKRIILILGLLASSAALNAEPRREVIISPEVYIHEKKDIDSNRNQINKNILGNGVKILFETKDGLEDNAELGIGTGITYNALKVKGTGINSNSGRLITVPMYITIGGGSDNGPYIKTSLGFVLRSGNVKWTDNKGGAGEIKAPFFGGYAAIGAGYRKDRFSIGVSAATTTKGKRSYTSPTESYSDKISLSGAVITLDLGLAY